MRYVLRFLLATLVGVARPGEGQVAPRAEVRVDVNVPAFRVELWHGGERAGSWPVAVGSRRYDTPTGAYAMGWLEWNPWWIPPKSAWAARDTVTPPGPQNPMGRVKLAIGDAYFIHGTPADSSIGRAMSHGCLRMHNADVLELAQRVLRATGVDSATVAMQAMDTVTRRVTLAWPVPVAVRYDVVEWRAGALYVYPDVYRRGAATVTLALRVLATAGVDTLGVRRDVVRRAVTDGRVRLVVVPADSLVGER